MRLPSYITSEAADIIEREYPTNTDSAALASRLGITVPQLHCAARQLRCYKLHTTKSHIQHNVTTCQQGHRLALMHVV